MNVGMRDIQLRLRKVRNVAPILIRTLMLLIASCLLTEGACFGGLLPCTGQVIQHPSGQVAPIGDIPGWHQIFVEDFNTDVAVGSFLGAAYKDKFTVC